MPARSFAPSAALVALLAATVLACGEDLQSPTSTDPGAVVGWSTLASGRAHAFPE